MSPTLSAVMQACATCSGTIPESPRYPRRVCAACEARATAADGRRLTFGNQELSGGFVARYVDTGQEHPGHECFIDGIRCHADEARLGGIVVEVVP